MIANPHGANFAVAFRTVMYSLILGPLYGTAATLLGTLFAIMIGNSIQSPMDLLKLPIQLLTGLGSIIITFPVFAYYGYKIGIIQAVIAGFVYASIGSWQGRLNFWAIVPAFAVPFALVESFGSMGKSIVHSVFEIWDFGETSFAAVHLVAATGVFFSVRGLWRTSGANAQ